MPRLYVRIPEKQAARQNEPLESRNNCGSYFGGGVLVVPLPFLLFLPPLWPFLPPLWPFLPEVVLGAVVVAVPCVLLPCGLSVLGFLSPPVFCAKARLPASNRVDTTVKNFFIQSPLK